MKIKEVIGKSYFKIDSDQYTDERLAFISIDDLKNLKTRIEMKIKTLTAQMKIKKIEYIKSGPSTEREWYTNRKYALSVNQRMLPFLSEMINQRNRKERSLADYFLDEARVFLDKETYNAIMQNAMREKKLLSGR